MGTGFDRYFDARMKKASFAKAYAKARTEIDRTDQVLQLLDDARAEARLSKAELARKIHSSPVVIRRLFASKVANPSFATISRLARAMGLRLVLEPVQRKTARSFKKRSGPSARPR